MKIQRYILILLVLPVLGCGQLTYTSSCGENFYTTNVTYSVGYASYPFTADPGTNIYGYDFNANPGILRFRVFRSNNHWTIAGAYNTNQTVQFVSLDFSNEIDPPCDGLWEKYTNNVAGGSLCQIIFSGTTCMTSPDPNSTHFEALPQRVQMPRLITPLINQLPNPTRGMMVYDLTENCLKVYDNDSWECVEFTSNRGVMTKGATNQRPANPEPGIIFFNTQTQKYEGYTASGWVNLH